MGVASQHDHHRRKEHFPISLKAILHPPNYPPPDCCPNTSSFYRLCLLTVMGQESQVVMSIDQALFPTYIQSISFDAMDETVGAPTPLCRRSVHHLCCQTL
jgi:hypothetical protein